MKPLSIFTFGKKMFVKKIPFFYFYKLFTILSPHTLLHFVEKSIDDCISKTQKMKKNGRFFGEM
jgi:hypothetical protein